MSTIAYIPLHYGADYLPWTLRSIRPHVDEIIIMYYAEPCVRASIPCPDKRDVMYDIAMEYDAWWSDRPNCRLSWGQRCDEALELVYELWPEMDVAMVSDSDEVWDSAHLQACIELAHKGTAKEYLVTMQHYWRSFDWVCHDEARPRRFNKLHNYTEPTNYLPREIGNAHHFGYAIRDGLMRYKWIMSDHRGELRKGWLDDIWSSWMPGDKDVHPVCGDGYWNPQPFDKSEIIDLVGDHPFYDLEMIL